MTTSSVVVAGGGLAGLRTAERLASGGVDVRLFERESTLGGRVTTVSEGPYQFDAGFQVLLTAYPAVREALDLDALDLRRFPPGATICRPNHRATVADPVRAPRKLFETVFSRDVTVGDKMRIIALRRDLGRQSIDDVFEGPDRSIRSELSRRGFSSRFVERFATPFFGGITLDRSLSTSKRVFEYTFRMMAEGAVAVPADGMGAIPDQVAEAARHAGATIETGATVERVDANGGTASVAVDGRSIEADAVVVATDPRSSNALTGVDSIPTDGRGCVTQYFSLPTGSPLDGKRYLMLNAAGAIPNQVAPIGEVAPEYAPDDELLLSATTVGDTELPDDELAARTRETIASWYPEAAFEALTLKSTVRCPFAQFVQPPGVHETLPDVRDPDGRVYLAGDYIVDSSINGALESGTVAAQAVLADLKD
ncbi:MAG: NAD(P)/FAD-dependent oxidoreductase [Halanaeroarchaeum sp.]